MRRRPEERLLSDCGVTMVRHEGGNVIFWGCFAGNQVGALVRINGKMDQNVYHNILVRHAIPSGRQPVGQNLVLQQHNDPNHTSKLCTNYLQKN